MKKIIFLFLVFYMSACNQKTDKYVGLWIVTDIYIYNETILPDLFSQAIDFKKNGNIDLPVNDLNYINTSKEIGVWHSFSNDTIEFIDIKTNNELFNHCFEVRQLGLFQDPNSGARSLEMVLTSDSILIYCTKATNQHVW